MKLALTYSEITLSRRILILSMLRIKGAVLLLYTALIIYSEIEMVYFHSGLSFCVLLVLNLLTLWKASDVLDAEMKEGTRLGIGLANKKEQKLPVDEEGEIHFGPWNY